MSAPELDLSRNTMPLIRSVNGHRTVFTKKADLEKARQSDKDSMEQPKTQTIQQPNNQQPILQDAQQSSIKDIRPPSDQDYQPLNIREELIEALKGLTIKLEIRLCDVIDENSLTSVSNKLASESDSGGERSTSDETREYRAIDGHDKSEISSRSDQSATTDKEQVLHSKVQPNLVHDFKSKIRPVASLKSERPSTDNFTPLQVLKRQAAKQVSKSQNGCIKPKTAVKIESIDTKSSTKAMSPLPSQGAQGGEGDKKSTSTGILCPPTSATSPAKMLGKIEVGTIINSCRLSDDGQYSYITYSNEAILQVDSILSDMATDIEILPRMREINVDDCVFAKSLDGNIWYRAKVMEVYDTQVRVYYSDWGLSELLPWNRIRYLGISGLSFAVKPACAIKVTFTNDADLIEPLLDEPFEAKVLSYNELDNIYTMTVIC